MTRVKGAGGQALGVRHWGSGRARRCIAIARKPMDDLGEHREHREHLVEKILVCALAVRILIAYDPIGFDRLSESGYRDRA